MSIFYAILPCNLAKILLILANFLLQPQLFAKDKLITGDEFIQRLNVDTPTQQSSAEGDSHVTSEVAMAIHFRPKTAELADAFSQQQLQAVGAALASKELLEYRFEIGGHTDNTGNDADNLQLSQQRAEAVRDILCQVSGVDCTNLEAVGYGETNPIASNANKAGRAQNRRITIKRLNVVMPNNQQPYPLSYSSLKQQPVIDTSNTESEISWEFVFIFSTVTLLILISYRILLAVYRIILAAYRIIKDIMTITDLFRPKWKHSNWLVRRNAVHEITDQSILAKIAKTDQESDVRQDAVLKLTSQDILANIAKTDKEAYVRMAAVSKITDQAILANISNIDSDLDVCAFAVRKLTNQAIIADIATKHNVSGMRRAAVIGLTDQTVLAKIAKTDQVSDVRKAAVNELTDQAILADIAKTDKESNVRLAAVSKLNDQVILAKIAKTATDKVSDVSLAAVSKLTNQAILADVAKISGMTVVRVAAVNKLTNQAILAKIAKTDKVSDVSLVAVSKLTDQAIIADVATTSGTYDVREAAVNKLTDQAILAEIAKTDEVSDISLAAVSKLTDQAILADVAKISGMTVVRVAAVGKLTNQVILADVAKTDSLTDVRRAAVARLATLAETTKTNLLRVTHELLSIELIDSKDLGNPGTGGDAFQKAIQSANQQDDNGAIRFFEQALELGLDTLRQGYAHSRLGERKLKQGNFVDGVEHLFRVLTLKQALYDSVHTAAQYLNVILLELGRTQEAQDLQTLVNKTQAKLGYSLSAKIAEEIRQLVKRSQANLPIEALKRIPVSQAASIPTARDLEAKTTTGEVVYNTGEVRLMVDYEMLNILKELCYEYSQNGEYKRLEPIATSIGEELNQRGGIGEMRRIFALLNECKGSRTLEMHWGGIGDWQG